MLSVFAFVLRASGLLATTYGYGELRCGDVDKPQECSSGSLTASGEEFDPTKPTAALAVPNSLKIRPQWISMRVEGGVCQWVRLNDRKNERYVGKQAQWDLSPAAVQLLTGRRATKTWSGRVYLCTGSEIAME